MANNDFDYDIFGTGSEPEEKQAVVEEPAAPVEEPAAPIEEPAAPIEEPAATPAASENGFYDVGNPDAEFEVPSEFKTGKQGRAADAVFGMGKKQKAPKNEAFYGAAAPQKAGPSTGVVILLLLFFWPVGLYLMWKYQKFSKVARIVITAILVFFTLLGFISSMVSGCTNKDPDLPNYSQSAGVDGSESGTEAPANNGEVTDGQAAALAAAKSWLEYINYGPTGLKNALMGNGYSEDEADYAVANCGADWTEQCNKKVENYVSYGYTESTIRFFLEGEGFTEEQLNNALAMYPPTATE